MPAAGPDPDQAPGAESEKLLDHDAHAGRPHPGRLDAHRSPPIASGEPEQTAVIVHLADAAGVEPLADPPGAVGIAGQEHQRRVVAGLGAEVDLWHAG